MSDRHPSPLSNSLFGAFVEGGMEMLRPLLVGVIAFGLGVVGVALHEMNKGASRVAQSNLWRWKREREREEERKAGK